MQTFHAWLEHRPEEAAAAAQLALMIARSGTVGVSRDDIARALGCYPETLEEILRALQASGQVVLRKVGGRLVYRVAG